MSARKITDIDLFDAEKTPDANFRKFTSIEVSHIGIVWSGKCSNYCSLLKNNNVYSLTLPSVLQVS